MGRAASPAGQCTSSAGSHKVHLDAAGSPLSSCNLGHDPDIVLGDPARPVAAARRVGLRQVPGEFSLVVPRGQLQKGRVQPQQALRNGSPASGSGSNRGTDL